MTSVLERYGIKEVADCTFYNINADGTPGTPVLYLDSLKVSTVEQTAETTYATGGKGNPRLIGWDFGKEITLNLEDALFSPKSMAIMFGDGTVGTDVTSIIKTILVTAGPEGALPSKWVDASGNEREIPAGAKKTGEDGEPVTTPVEGDKVFLTFDVDITGQQINVDSNTFPGVYYITGDTFARNEVTGKDEYFQIVIPKGKITSENSLTLEAEGDPTVFTMTVDVLRAGEKDMMKLIKYDIS